MMIVAELYANQEWIPVELELALKMPRSRRMRCPECHGRVRVHKEGSDGQRLTWSITNATAGALAVAAATE